MYEWNAVTYQMLGNIVFLIMSGKAEKRREGYIRYFELKKDFPEEEFNSMILELDNYRREHNHRPVIELIDEIRVQIIDKGLPSDSKPEYAVIPPLEQIRVNNKPVALKQAKKEEVEQLDLFST